MQINDNLKLSNELLDFIFKSPSCFHAADNIAAELTANGYTELGEGDSWELRPGCGYFIRRNLSSVIAFRIPVGRPSGIQISASHSDSPAFRIKENMDIVVDNAYTELNVEKYGGTLCATWFDRPLSAAGKLVLRDGDFVRTRLVNVDRDLMMLPSLAIHMNRNVNDGYKYSIQKDMLPLLGDERAAGRFMEIVADAAGVSEKDIIASDLFLYCRGRGAIWGADGEYISSPRLDDLQCAFACLKGFLTGNHPDAIPVYAVFDNEEVGSTTRQGAASTLLSDTLLRITGALGLDYTEYLRLIASGYMVSADNAHAVHPNHIASADPTNHPHINKGIVIKFSARKKYSTDSVSAAIFRTICSRAGVPTQSFHNHSDMQGGSTLGNISNSQVSINMVDIGLPQLAMHSAVETAGIMDTGYLVKAMKEFYSTLISDDGSGCYRLRRAPGSESSG